MLGAMNRWSCSAATCNRRTLSHLVLSQLVTLLFLTSMLDAASKQIRCYSCVSTSIAGLWQSFSYDKMYIEQLEQSINCNNPDSSKGVQWKICTSGCMQIVEPIPSPSGNNVFGYIRGCHDVLLRNGYNPISQTAVRLEYRDMCVNMTWDALSPNVGSYRDKFRSVYACSCQTDLCNAAAILTMSTTAWTMLIATNVIGFFYRVVWSGLD